jgi:hypothetical protein
MMKSLRPFGLAALLAVVLPLAACSGDASMLTAPPAPHFDASGTDSTVDPLTGDDTSTDAQRHDTIKNSISNIR